MSRCDLTSHVCLPCAVARFAAAGKVFDATAMTRRSASASVMSAAASDIHHTYPIVSQNKQDEHTYNAVHTVLDHLCWGMEVIFMQHSQYGLLQYVFWFTFKHFFCPSLFETTRISSVPSIQFVFPLVTSEVNLIENSNDNT